MERTKTIRNERILDAIEIRSGSYTIPRGDILSDVCRKQQTAAASPRVGSVRPAREALSDNVRPLNYQSEPLAPDCCCRTFYP